MDVPMYVWMYLCSIFVDSGPTEWAGPGTGPGPACAASAPPCVEAHPPPAAGGCKEPGVEGDPVPNQAPSGWPQPVGQDRGKGMSFSTYPR